MYLPPSNPLIMKTTNRLLILITIVLLSFSNTTYGQKDSILVRKARTIILNVNVAEITNKTINEHSNFGQGKDSSNEEFTIYANVGDIIIWKGLPYGESTEGDIVNITGIHHRNGNDIFSKNMLSGNGGEPEKVVGLVLNLAPKGMEYKYKIFFTVIHDGKKKHYHIDPKIQVDD